MTETASFKPVAPPAKPLLDFSTPEEVQKAYLALFGLFMLLPTAVMGFILCGFYIGPSFAIAGGLGAVMFVGGFLGFLTVIIRQAVQQVQIRVIQK